jgi:porin
MKPSSRNRESQRKCKATGNGKTASDKFPIFLYDTQARSLAGHSRKDKEGIIMKSTVVLFAVIILLTGIFLNAQAFAEAMPAPNYSGEFLTRSTLTGDWGGARNDLAKKGVTFDLNLTQVGQGDVSGGKKTGWEYEGRGDLTLNLDTQKLGLWPGGFITVEVEGNFGNSVNLYTGSLLSVNTSHIFPTTGSDQLNIPNVSIMQFFSHYIAVLAGKIATITSNFGDMNEFAHGKGDTQFFNLALNANPTVLMTMPYSTLGASVIILPTKNPAEAIISMMALDGNGEAKTSGFDTVFKGNTVYAIEGRVRTDFFGMTGHQLMGATYSARNFASIDQNLRFIIENRAIEQKNNSWSFHYNFDQYVYEPKKGQGIGIFGRFGASDGNPNPVHYFYSIGVGGKGVISGRPLDQFGIGYYYMDINSPKFTGPLATRETLRDEQGLEAYYNFAITPWMKLTPDIQFIRPAHNGTVSIGAGVPPTITTKSLDTATVVGLRLQIVF